MKLKFGVLLLLLLTSQYALATGFVLVHSKIAGNGDDALILMEWIPLSPGGHCGVECCGDVQDDCCHYIALYANGSGIYYVGYLYELWVTSNRNGVYLPHYFNEDKGVSVWRGYRGCFQQLGGVSSPYRLRVLLPYAAAMKNGHLDVYHIACSIEKIGAINASPDCNFNLGPDLLTLHCKNGIRRFRLSPEGIKEVEEIEWKPWPKVQRPSMVNGVLKNDELVFSNGSKTYRIPLKDVLPYLQDPSEAEFLLGVFMENYLLILPPTISYHRESCNGTTKSTLTFVAKNPYKTHTIENVSPKDLKPVYGFIYNGELKAIPLLSTDGYSFKPLAQKVVARDECPCSGESRLSAPVSALIAAVLISTVILVILLRKR
ncbi:hypothetical protein [Thermococcus radiotolerans]|uniref:Uncharacterized protein n=1 Tax=Thermococcus radiotolerans TaxID=187880 RepID=A0A2Z2MZ06_9EURY|nr:hypothetical protein [Thermococcus radiotolerans]ASJ15045.1 hypothetical protein A3L10_07855 [Thermococcus radiotolerans]